MHAKYIDRSLRSTVNSNRTPQITVDGLSEQAATREVCLSMYVVGRRDDDEKASKPDQ